MRLLRLQTHSESTIQDATAYTESAKRKTVTAGDIVNALKKKGKMMVTEEAAR